MDDHLNFTLRSELWIYQGKAAWFFVTVPEKESAKIKFFSADVKRGWGSVRVSVKIGDTQWNTSIFPDSKSGTYLLPVKAEIRKKEKLKAGDMVVLELQVMA
jgi:hypothetical protein